MRTLTFAQTSRRHLRIDGDRYRILGVRDNHYIVQPVVVDRSTFYGLQTVPIN